ncbi:MAG: MotA/TolQ/ExbB proton channel family protein [Myxococcaceae bacterium]
MDTLTNIFHHMGAPAIAVASTLLAMALASLAIFFERLFAFWRSRSASRKFAATARALLESGDTAGLAKKADESRGHLAQLLGAGAKTYVAASSKPTSLSPVEAARRELLRKTEAVAADVRRGMSIIASVGSIAPFVGLLGTVFGIITAFQGIAKEGSGGLGAVSMGISEALYETALGLVVAIPAVLAFNWLSAQADALLLALEQVRGEFIDFLEARHTEGLRPAVKVEPQRGEEALKGALEEPTELWKAKHALET